MADFELEQLKTLFQNLADRLSNTKGDEYTIAKLALLEKSLNRIAGKIGEHDSKAVIDSKALANKFSKEFLDELKRIAPSTSPHDGSSNTGAGRNQGPLNIDFDKSTGGAFGKIKQFGSMVSGVSKALQSFGDGTVKAVNNIRSMDGSFGGLATAMGVGSGAIGAFAKVLDDNVNTYRAVQSSAEGSIHGFEDMHQAMLTSISSASEFADAMTKGSDGVRLLGGMDWAKMNQGFRKATAEVGYYAMSVSQMRDAQSAYLDMMKNQGTLFDLNQDDLVKGMTELVKSSKESASILGKNREDTLKQIANQSLDANFQAFLKSSGYDPKQVMQINTLLGSLPDELQGIVKESSQLYGGFSDSDKAQKSAVIQGTDMGDFVNQLIQGIYSKRAGGDNYVRDNLGAFQSAGKNADVARGGTAASLNAAGAEQFGFINRMTQAGAMLKPKELADEQRKQEDANSKDPGKVAVLSAEVMAKQAAATMDAAINKVFDNSLKQFGPQMLESVHAIDAWTAKLQESIKALDGIGGSALLLAGIAGSALAIGSSVAIATTVSSLVIKKGASIAANGLAKVGQGAKAVGDAALEGAKKTGTIFKSAAATAEGAAAGAATATEAGVAGVAKAAEGAVDDAGKAIANAAEGVKPVAPPEPATNVKPTPAEPVKPGTVSEAKPSTAGAVADGAADAGQAMSRGSKALSAAQKAAAFAKKLGPLAYILQGAQTYGELTDLNAKHEAGEINDDDFKKEFSKSLARALGGIGGGILGAELGAGVGAAGGTLVAPGLGTAIGGIGGGLAGGFAGAWGGEKLADQLTDSMYNAYFKSAPSAQPINGAQPNQQQNANNGNTPANPVMPPNADMLAQSRNSIEVPLTARDIKQPFDNLQTAIVTQLEISNKYLEAIRDLIRINNEVNKDGNTANVQSLTDLQRMLEDAVRSNRVQQIY